MEKTPEITLKSGTFFFSGSETFENLKKRVPGPWLWEAHTHTEVSTSF